MRNIFERMKAGELILSSDPEYSKVLDAIKRAMEIVGELNSSYKTADETRAIISELVGYKLEESVWIVPPFYTDFGQFLKIGKGVFINNGCTCWRSARQPSR